jgi:hypothetical protein
MRSCDAHRQGMIENQWLSAKNRWRSTVVLPDSKLKGLETFEYSILLRIWW